MRYAAQWSFDLTQWLVCIEPLLFWALNQLDDNMSCTFYISIGIRRWRQSKRKQFRNSSWHFIAIIRSVNGALCDSSSGKTALKLHWIGWKFYFRKPFWWRCTDPVLEHFVLWLHDKVLLLSFNRSWFELACSLWAAAVKPQEDPWSC